MSPFCSFPSPRNESPSAGPQAALTPGGVARRQGHHCLTPAPLRHEKTKTGPNGSVSLFSFVCSSLTHSLVAEDWFKAGGRHRAPGVI